MSLRRRPQLLLAVAAAVALAIPCFGYVYLFDDFDFVERAQTFRPGNLLPDARSLFYRPLSREIVFGLLHFAHLDSPAVFHVLNSVLLAIAVVLVVLLASRLLGPRAGVIAGLWFGSLGALPLLVGWASGIQDLLAIDFLLWAILLQLEGRSILAALVTGASILSKETAAVLVPLLATQNWILTGRRQSLRSALPYAALLIAWAMIHPGLHLLLERRFQSGGTGYLGLDNPDRVSSIVRSVLTLFNVPVAPASSEWIGTRLVALLLGSAAVVWCIASLGDKESSARDVELQYPKGRVLTFALLVAVLPILLTAALVRFWSPYYACLPAIGTSLIAATLIRDLRPGRLVTVMLAFLVLGVIARGAEVDPSITTEKNLERTSRALRQLEAGFKRLYPSLEPGSIAYVFTQAHGIEGVYTHVYRFQALRVWYEDPSLLTSKPQRREPENRREYLFWIAPNLDVGEIDPVAFRARSSSETRPPYFQYQKTLRAYAMGLAASGELMRGVQILVAMPQRDFSIWGLDARIAAALLLAEGRADLAGRLLSRVPGISREDALATVAAVLAESPPGLNLDEAVLIAFGLRPGDAAATRALMKWFLAYGYDGPALRFAHRLVQLDPGDAEASATVRTLSQKRQADLLTPRSLED